MSAADDASLTASLFAVDPPGLGGVCLRSAPQPARIQWLDILRSLLPASAALRRIPFNIAAGRLLGGLDLTATLRANRPVGERGALAAADGGVVIVTMAERLSAHTTACIDAALDGGEVATQREGVEIRDRARIGIVALDEGIGDEERLPEALADRLAFLVDLNGFDLRTPLLSQHEAADILAARLLLPRVTAPAQVIEALCATAMALGAGSVRVSLRALQAARVLAALDGRTEVGADDAATAGRLVLAPRATMLPETRSNPDDAPDRETAPEDGGAEHPAAPPEDGREPAAPSPESQEQPATAHAGEEELRDVVLAAVRAALPEGLLERLRHAAPRGAAGPSGRSGAARVGGSRGRPSGVRGGTPRGPARLNVMETLRAAAPWQRLRGRLAGDARVRIDPDDFRVTRYQQRSQTLTIFVVDASGSAALNRLAEAKGAVELLLADCYVRRDQVAVVAFRGRSAELLLPPTRSLVRAKRNLAGLPGGGGTPLASALDSAFGIAAQAQRRGDTPVVVLLTDGRANVARDGSGGREAAHADALTAARRLRQARVLALFVDTSPRPNALAQSVAQAMGAQYVALPFADARTLSGVVGAALTR